MESAASGASETLRVFLNYRREETSGHAGRLFDDLAERLEGAEVFMDIDRIAPGVDFTEVIDEALDSCDVVLALIGRRWIELADAGGRRRLDDADDFVRLELEKALGRKDVRVIPVLVHGASMPPSRELPDRLRSLARRQAFELSDTRWHYDLNMLVQALEKVSRIKVEQAFAAAEAAEAARVEAERFATERAETERLEAERLQAARLEAERAEAERARAEAERLEAERQEAGRLEEERHAAERARLEAQRRERERLEQERLAAQREQERVERERLRREAAEAEQVARERRRTEDAEQTARPRRGTAVLVGAVAVAVAGLGALGAAIITQSGGQSPAAPRLAPRVVADALSLGGADHYVIPAATLVANDRGDGLRIVGVRGGGGLHGSLELSRNAASLVYTPDGGYDGPFRFTYTVRDDDGDLGVGTVTGRVKGLSTAQKDLVALVPPASRGSCVAGRSSVEISCHLPVGELVLRRYTSRTAAASAFAARFRAAEGACSSSPGTGQWSWPDQSERRGRFGCSNSGGPPTFGWTYPSRVANVLAVVAGGRGITLKKLSTWFFEQARLPRPR